MTDTAAEPMPAPTSDATPDAAGDAAVTIVCASHTATDRTDPEAPEPGARARYTVVERSPAAVTVRGDDEIPTGESVVVFDPLTPGVPRLMRRQRLPAEPAGEYHLREVQAST
jgi:hypothetical protein